VLDGLGGDSALRRRSEVAAAMRRGHRLAGRSVALGTIGLKQRGPQGADCAAHISKFTGLTQNLGQL
jgi:hypothetical protein